MPQRLEYTTEQLDDLAARYQSGRTTEELAREEGCSTASIGNLLRRHGVELRRPGRRAEHGGSEEAPLAYTGGWFRDGMVVRPRRPAR